MGDGLRVRRSLQGTFHPIWILPWRLRRRGKYHDDAVCRQAELSGERIECAVKSETGCRHGGRLTFTYRLFGRARIVLQEVSDVKQTMKINIVKRVKYFIWSVI